MKVNQYLKNMNLGSIDNSYYSYIDEWLQWYKGKIENFHSYTIYNGIQHVHKERYALGMAKKISEDWANLLLNEKVAIACDELPELDTILEKNNFQVKGNQLIELAFALGTAAIVEYMGDGGNIVIDYIRADMIYPISWDNGEIKEVAFASPRRIKDKDYFYIQRHMLENGVYVLYNSLVEEDSCKEIDAYESILNNIVPVVYTGSREPLFQIIKPNVVNNVDLDCPMGLSVFANAIDNLKGTDLIYDSYCMEFELGKKRLLVPVSMAKMQMASDGITTPVFDSNDITFYAVPDAEDFHDLSPTIRAQEHEMGIQKALSLLSNMCGLGNDRYSFEKGVSKTATEVISEKSELFQNRQKHNIIVVDALIKMVKAIGFLTGKQIKDVTIDTDDSIIQDENATIERNILLLSNGLQTKVRALMEIHKMTEDDANKLLEQIKEESEISADNVDIIGMGDNNDTNASTRNSTDDN